MGFALITKSAAVDSTACVVVCIPSPTVKVVLITLLLGFGSKPAGIVVTTHVNLCVPGVAVHGVCKGIGIPTGPG